MILGDFLSSLISIS